MQINRDYETTDACYPYNDPAWIIIHYTAGSYGVTARDNAIYFKRVGAELSVGTHYFLGDDGIFASTPEQYGAWTNGNWDAGHSSITIEVACGTDEPGFTDTEVSLLSELVPDIMRRYGIDADHVIRHYDVVDYFGGSTTDPHKACPRQYVNWDAWKALRDTITGGDMATPGELWGYNWTNAQGKPTAPGGNMYNCAVNTNEMVHSISAKVDKIQTGGIDYAKLAQSVAPLISQQIAKSVADEICVRMKA